MNQLKNKKLVLETGQEFSGIGFASDSPAVGEIVFNTSMVGYQEIISDPAYAGQIVVMTYPLMGQYGITEEDFESRAALLSGIVVRENCDTPSNFRYIKTFAEELEDRGVAGIQGLDTRMLTRIIREKGSMKAAIVDEGMDTMTALKLIASTDTGVKAAAASCTKRWFSRTPHHKFDVVVVDCGLKHSIVSALNRSGCNVTVVPADTTADEIASFSPDGVIISSGPGNPADMPELIGLVRTIKGRFPLLGISLGHEIIALAYGAKVMKLKVGHHGGHPVRNLETGRIITAEHNNNWCVDEASLEGTGLKVTYRDVADGVVDGLECAEDKVFSVQFYPEGAPGPKESDIFDKFVNMMED